MNNNINIKVYNKKVIALVWEYIVLNSFNTIYSYTSAITYSIGPCLCLEHDLVVLDRMLLVGL